MRMSAVRLRTVAPANLTLIRSLLFEVSFRFCSQYHVFYDILNISCRLGKQSIFTEGGNIINHGFMIYRGRHPEHLAKEANLWG